MAQSLQNQMTYAKSMSGIITLSDGAGSIIENGTVTSNNLNTNILTSNSLVLPRNSTPAVNTVEGPIDVGNTLQNIGYDNTGRLLTIDNDGGGPMMSFTTYTEVIQMTPDVVNMYPGTEFIIETSTKFQNGTCTFTNCPIVVTGNTIRIPRISTAAVKLLLSTSIELTELLQNLFFDILTRSFEIWNDTATYAMVAFNTNTNTITFKSPTTFNTNLPTSTLTPTSSTQLITKAYGDATYTSLSGINTWTSLNTFTGGLVADKFLQNLNSLSASTISWAFGDKQNILLTSATAITFNLPSVSATTQYGTQINIYCTLSPGITFNAFSGFTFKDEINAAVSTKAYSNSYNTFSFMAISTTGTQWKMIRYQGITIDYANSTYGRLGSSNTWTGVNTYNTVLPSSTIAATSGNQLTNKTYVDTKVATVPVYIKNDANNNSFALGAGNNSLTAGNNIGFGLNALSSITTAGNNVGLGLQSLQNLLDGTENFGLGTNSLQGLSSGSFNTAIGVSTGGNLTNGISNVFIGRYVGGGLTFQNDNTFCGYFAGVSSSGSSNTIYGAYTLGTGCSGSSNCIVGGYAGTNLTGSGSSNTLLGNGANVSSGNLNNTVAIGYGSTSQADYEFVLGADNHIITIPNKMQLAVNQLLTGVITLSFRSPENILLTDAATNTINLPTPTATNIGCKFLIHRRVTGVNISIVPPAGQSVSYVKYEGSYTTTTGSYTFLKENSYLRILCIGSTAGGTNWLIITNATNEASNSLYVSSTVSIPATKYSIPFGGDVSSAYQTMYMNNSNLNFQSSTNTLTSTNILSTKVSSSTYQYNVMPALITAASTLADPLSSLYTFTMKTAAAFAITMPAITSSNVGTQITFKRIGGSLQILSMTTVSNQPTFLSGIGLGTTTATNAIISATQSSTTIVASQTQDAGTGTYNVTAGSALITVATQTSGTLSIGGIINCQGNIRYILSYGTGLGGTGTYNLNATLPTASLGLSYTSSVTYGWVVTNIC